MNVRITSAEDEKKALVEKAIQKANQITEEAILNLKLRVGEFKASIEQAIDLEHDLVVAQIYGQHETAIKQCAYQSGLNMSDIAVLKTTLTSITTGCLRTVAINSAQLKHKLTEVELAALGVPQNQPRGF